MAALVAKDLLERVTALLQDPDNARWSLSELTDALNDGLLEACLIKPSAFAETVELEMQEGTWQMLSAGQSQLLRVVRNITSAADASPRVAGPAITMIERDALDNQIPDWHDASAVPFEKTVQHVMTDELNPTDFYVFPGNDGTGRIEAMVAIEPTLVSKPADDTDLAGYDDELDIAPIYKSALIDYMLYQAYMKDMQMAGAGQRAVSHYQSFLQKLGSRRKVEAVANPETA